MSDSTTLIVLIIIVAVWALCKWIDGQPIRLL